MHKDAIDSEFTTAGGGLFNALATRADSLFNLGFESLLSVGFSPATRLARHAVLSLFQRIQFGHLSITSASDPSQKWSFGRQEPDFATALNEPVCEVTVHNDAFWLRLVTMSDLGFSEAYMYGDIDVSDLLGIMKIFLLNQHLLSPSPSNPSTSSSSTSSYSLSLPLPALSSLITKPQAYLSSSRFVNSIAGSRKNIAAHYDISNEMFAAFLSEDMTYSCAIFEELDADLAEKKRNAKVSARDGRANLNEEGKAVEGGDDAKTPNVHANPPPSRSMTEDALFDAEMRKLKHIIAKADIKSHHRVLEVGTGWGSFAILAAQSTGCRVDSITLSPSQASLARTRISSLGLSHLITVHLMDYRDIPSMTDADGTSWRGAFDRVVSIEMMEAIGREFLEGFWGVVEGAMRGKDAVGVVQVITIPEARLEKYSSEVDFIRKWVRSGSPLRSSVQNTYYLSPDTMSFPVLIFTSPIDQIFPGGFLPSLSLLLSTLTSGSHSLLTVDSVTNIGPHYARTLREWRDRFEAKFEDEIVPALERTYPNEMGEGQRDEKRREEAKRVFWRKWVYYFVYCEIGFAERLLGTHIVTFTREGNTAYGVQV